MNLDKYKSPNTQYNLHEYVMNVLNGEIEHLKTLSETVLKRSTKSKYIDAIKKLKY